MDRQALMKPFLDPGAEFRSAPFWAWNGKLEKEELVRQIEGMKEQGIGGFFMHSRDGLETEYMGAEWFDRVREAVKAAEDNGMIAWIYDEDRWPSGSAGGLVPASGDAYRAKGLTIEVTTEAAIVDESVAAAFLARIDGMELLDEKRLECRTGDRLPRPNAEDGEALLLFRVEVAEAVEWFNDEAPHDNLNPDAVKLFLDTTYEAYKREVGEQFGKTIAGVFTDEPSVADRHCRFTEGRGWIPWTYSFPEFYRERRGRDPFETLPHVFFNGKRSPEARHDYWRSISDMFSESFSGQLGSWCEENGLQFTGHYLWENKLGIATRVCGAIMPNYRYQHVPGIDILMEQADETITVKQCTSVANQYGRERVITETYGCAGWEFTFEGQKWVGDFQYALGVNLRSQHLALYSIKGCRKRDYPPVFNYNTTWWEHQRVVEDYFARIGAIMQPGTAVRDVLVLHPASTSWAMLGANPYGIPDRNKDRDIPAINRYGDEFNRFLRSLLGAHYDFDLGDETIMAEKGRVENDRLFVHLAGYRIVVMPAMKTMLRSTHKLLLEFLEAGGCVIAVEPVPSWLEGREDEAALSSLLSYPNLIVVRQPSEVIPELERRLARQISLTGPFLNEAPEMLYLLKEQEDCRTLFVVNNDRDKTLSIRLSAAFGGKIEEWDPLTGRISEVEADTIDGRLVFDAEFAPAASRLYVIAKEGSPRSTSPKRDDGETALNPFAIPLHASLGPTASFTRTMPNALVLDRCAYRLEGAGSGWSEEMDVWQAQRAVRERLGMRQVYYNGLPQRYKWAETPHPSDGRKLELRFRFEVEEVPESAAYLALEEAEHLSVSLNGRPSVRAKEGDGWFIDRQIRRVPIEGLRKGTNELIFSCSYANRLELEDAYLIGDFAVTPSRAIAAEPKKLRFGDWTLQGYLHYAGSLIYHFDIECSLEKGESAYLYLGEYSATTISVRVNGRVAGEIPWRAANGLDIGEWLEPGANRIDIEAVGSPRNLFGPFHQARGAVPSTGWESFRTEGTEYTPEYAVHPYGLYEPVQIRKRR